MERLAAIVLAAGCSSRTQSFRPLLEIEGRTLLEHAVAVFRDVAVDDVSVVTGHNADAVEAMARRLEAHPVANSRYRQGVGSSIRAGVAALAPGVERFFLLPVDCALVRPETVGRLARAGAALGADIVRPAHGGATGYPALFNAGLREEILSGEPPGDLRVLFTGYAAPSARVDVDDPGVTFDADSAGDLDQARALAIAARLPSEKRCLAILRERGASPDLVAHSRAVAAVATALTSALNGQGHHLCLPLVAAAALLHDVARAEPDHAEVGAELLEGLGYPRVGAVVRQHMDLARESTDDLGEAEVLYLADRLVLGERLVALEDRFASRLREFSDDPAALAAARSRMDVAVAVRRRVEDVLGHRLPAVGLGHQVNAAPSSGRQRRARRLGDSVASSRATGGSSPVRAACRVVLHKDGELLFGPGPQQLFALVAETGSLHQAAKLMGMSYSKAWRITREAEERLGVALLRRRTGGIAGGGSALTPEGRQLVARFRALCDDADAAIERLYEEHFADAPFGGCAGASPGAPD